MEEAKGIIQEISYQVDCPHCNETSYSDIHTDDWDKLEHGDGYPYGELQCSTCDKSFYVSIDN